MVGAEPHLPYDRPPLSKQFLAGEWEADRLGLLKPEQLETFDLEWRLGVRAESLDVPGRTIALDDGSSVSADAIVIATGATPRTLPGTVGVAGVHVVRSLDDATALRHDLRGGSGLKVVVVGAGFIGAEAAATAAQAGHTVTIIEAGEIPMERGLGAQMGAFCGALHADHGVDLRLSTGVESVVTRETSSGVAVSGVVLSDGSTLDADVLVVGIGVIPETGWLEGSGLTIDNGVVCDKYCLAAPGIWAAGDIARWPNQLFGQTMRVEHWDNAVEQGMYVAKRILGEAAEPFAPVPWFWSDQYDHKIQLAGRPGADDVLEIVTGSMEDKKFAAIYGNGERLTGVFGLNRPRHVMQYRRLLADAASWQEALDFAEAARVKAAEGS
jgi:NADPH-dependent 2,4-dienoyl-CoA reductase/sulfur reductase-like enzyme